MFLPIFTKSEPKWFSIVLRSPYTWKRLLYKHIGEIPGETERSLLHSVTTHVFPMCLILRISQVVIRLQYRYFLEIPVEIKRRRLQLYFEEQRAL